MQATVVITTRNRRDDLRKAVASALAQTVEPEILVIDDGSTDGTSDLVTSQFPSVRLHRSEQSLGYIVQRNRAGHLASCPIIFSLDDDAVFSTPTVIETTLREFNYPRVGAVAIPFVEVNRGLTVLQKAPHSESVYAAYDFIGTAHAVRRDVFLSLSGYREILFHQGEEEDLCLRMLNAGWVTRCGNADPIHHFESPRRSFARMDFFGARNKILYAWHNAPFPWLLHQLAGTTVKTLAHTSHPNRFWTRFRGLLAGYALCANAQTVRRPVKRNTYEMSQALKRRGPLPLAEIINRLPQPSIPQIRNLHEYLSPPELEPSPAFDRQVKPLRWIVAQEGSRQTYAVPLAFNRLDKLRLFYADIWCRHGRSLLRRFSAGGRALAGRFRGEIPQDRVVDFNFGATVRQTMRHFHRGRQTEAALGEEHCRFGRWFAQRVRDHLRHVDLDPAQDAFFGFDTNSLEVLEVLKARRIFTILDQVDPGIIHEDMVFEEMKLWPGWQKFPDRMPQCYWDRRKAEWELADLVLVNSEWSRQATIKQGVPANKIVVVPLAIDLHHENLAQPVEPKGRLKVLWLGNVLVSKGIQYLVEAARILEREEIDFLLAGPMGIADKVVRDFPANIKILGRITRDQLGSVYRQAHVFVLPTISDGFAVTQLEAMAHGLPVVITPNCGRVVTDGHNGLIVPVRDGQALADALARLNADRQLVREMSRNALATIRNYDLPSNARLICDITRRERTRLGF